MCQETPNKVEENKAVRQLAEKLFDSMTMDGKVPVDAYVASSKMLFGQAGGVMGDTMSSKYIAMFDDLASLLNYIKELRGDQEGVPGGRKTTRP